MPGLDLNLLTALDALLSEASVSGAARRLGLSVSAMSRTLSRLRTVIADPILVPAGRAMVPTPHALAIRDRVQLLNAGVQEVLRPPPSPQIRDLQQVFVLRANEAFFLALAPALVAAVEAAAPGVQLRLVTKSDKDIRPLRDGHVDIDIGVPARGETELRIQNLYKDRFVGVARADHPLLSDGEITPQRYVAFDHVVASRRGLTQGPVDAALAGLGLTRRVKVVVSSFPVVRAIVATSDLLGLVPSSFSDTAPAGGKAGPQPTRTFPLPVPTPAISISQTWHPRMDANPGHRWLRRLIYEVCRQRSLPDG